MMHPVCGLEHEHHHHHHHKDEDHLTMLIQHLQSMPDCTRYLQTMFNQFDQHRIDHIGIDKLEQLLSILLIEAFTNCGHELVDTRFIVAHVRNELAQINHDLSPSSATSASAASSMSSPPQFTRQFIIHLLTHLRSLKVHVEQKASASPKHQILLQKQHLKISPKLAITDSNGLEAQQLTASASFEGDHREGRRTTRDADHRFGINRRRTNGNGSYQKSRRSQSDALSDERERAVMRAVSKSRSRSKSTDFHHAGAPAEFEPVNVILSASPSNRNALVMTENPLQKFSQPHHARPAPSTSVRHSSRLLPPPPLHHGHSKNGHSHPLVKPVLIGRVHGGNGNASTSSSSSSSNSRSPTAVHSPLQYSNKGHRSLPSKTKKAPTASHVHRSNSGRTKSKSLGRQSQSQSRKSKSKSQTKVRSRKSSKSNSSELDDQLLQIAERDVKISRRKTEHNLLQISRKSEYKDDSDDEVDIDDAQEQQEVQLAPGSHDEQDDAQPNAAVEGVEVAAVCDRQCPQTNEVIDDDDGHHSALLMTQLTQLTQQMSAIQDECRQSQLAYTTRISHLEQQLEAVQSERSAMQQTLCAYEQRIVQLERTIQHPHHQYAYPQPPPPPLPLPLQMSMLTAQRQVEMPPKTSRDAALNHIRSIISRSSHTSSRATRSTRSNSPSCSPHSHSSNHSHSHHGIAVSREADHAEDVSQSVNVYRALERQLVDKAEKRKHELSSYALGRKSRKNANLISRKKANPKKNFEPIELQSDIELELEGERDRDHPHAHDDGYGQDEDALPINPSAVYLPLVIDDSKCNQNDGHESHDHVNVSHRSNISALSGDDAIPAVSNHRHPSEDDVLQALERETEHTSLHAVASSMSTRSHTSSSSNASSSVLLDSDEMASSECARLFADAEGVSETDVVVADDDEKQMLKCRDLKYSVSVPRILIPKHDAELLKKAKPAYKYHLQMIDDDGSITAQIEQRRKKREREKQQLKQQAYNRQYAMHSRPRARQNAPSSSCSHAHGVMRYRDQREALAVTHYFESKPLGFQINEGSHSIDVTHVYRDRGSAYSKGIKQGWQITAVNREKEIKAMMRLLRSMNGPFHISFSMR